MQIKDRREDEKRATNQRYLEQQSFSYWWELLFTILLLLTNHNFSSVSKHRNFFWALFAFFHGDWLKTVQELELTLPCVLHRIHPWYDQSIEERQGFDEIKPLTITMKKAGHILLPVNRQTTVSFTFSPLLSLQSGLFLNNDDNTFVESLSQVIRLEPSKIDLVYRKKQMAWLELQSGEAASLSNDLNHHHGNYFLSCSTLI